MANNLSTMEIDTLNALQQLRVRRKFVFGWDDELVNQAFNLAYQSHKGQRRRTGEEFIVHVLGVARLVADFHCDLDTLLAALLHDVIEDTKLELNEIEDQFGKTTAIVVDALTKMPREQRDETSTEREARNLRKTIGGAAGNLRVAYIKLADRLHNLERRDPSKPQGSTRSSREALHYYVPIAGELGIKNIRRRLGLQCLDYELPDLKDEIERKAKLQQKEYRTVLNNVVLPIREDLQKKGMVKPRFVERSLFELLFEQNVLDREIEFPVLRDWQLFPIQVCLTFKSIFDCYIALKIIHERWNQIPGHFLDSTSNPLANGYQAIHTMVESESGDLILFILQTFEMYRESELGPLRRLVRAMDYEQELKKSQQEKTLQQILFLDNSVDDNEPDLFLEYLRLDVLRPKIRVFVSTKGVVIIPYGSTIIDLVFWADIPEEMISLSPVVNTNRVSLEWKLLDGDVVTFSSDRMEWPSENSYWKLGKTHVTAKTHYGLIKLGIL